MNGDFWYFAYGSNLRIDQKEARTGPIRQGHQRPRIARLPDYRLAFNKRGNGGVVYANVVASPGAEVFGVVYRCNPESMRKMDAKEIGYERKTVKVTADNGEALEAVTYVAKPEYVCPGGAPPKEYLARILKGAREHGLPEGYIKSIEALGGRGGDA
jgi:cation transport regulator ChaC